jgi:hypothetical protein
MTNEKIMREISYIKDYTKGMLKRADRETLKECLREWLELSNEAIDDEDIGDILLFTCAIESLTMFMANDALKRTVERN